MKALQESAPQHLAAIERVMAYLMSREDTFAVSRAEEDTIEGDETCTFVWYVSTPGGVKPAKVLVRGDRFNTGCLYFETTYDQQEAAGGGLMMTSTADYLFYFYLNTAELYIIRLPAFRDWMMENIDSFEPRRVAVKEGDGYRTALGRLIPLPEVETFPRVAKLQI